jgi:hypothetical protein
MLTLPLIAVVAAVVILGLAKLSLDPRVRARRAMNRTGSIRIGDVKDGEWAKVQGVVGAAGRHLTSPLTRRECIGYWVDVHRADQDLKQLLKKEACVAFSVTDDTGRLNVEGPFRLELDAEHDWSMVAEHQLGLLEAAGLPAADLARGRQFAYREGLLLRGDRIIVRGLAFLEPDPASPSSGLRAPLLIRRMRGSRDKPIDVADAD